MSRILRQNARRATLPLLAAVLFLPAVPVRADLDLTPRPTVYLAEGVKIPNLTFSDGKNEISYTPPQNWKCEGDSSRLLLLPKDKVQAEAIIEKAPPPMIAVFDDDGVKQLTKRALANVPQGSQKVTVVSEEKSPLKINGKDTFAVTISSVFFGQSVTTSLVYCNRGKEQLVFKLFCHSADFAELNRLFRGSLYSFQGF